MFDNQKFPKSKDFFITITNAFTIVLQAIKYSENLILT